MNKGQRNNSPVNLRFARQAEAVGKDLDGFAVFPNCPAGWRAAHNQIKIDQKRKLTLRQFIFKFAPPVENDTNAYLEFVSQHIGQDPDTPIDILSPYALAGVMAAQEGYYNK